MLTEPAFSLLCGGGYFVLNFRVNTNMQLMEHLYKIFFNSPKTLRRCLLALYCFLLFLNSSQLFAQRGKDGSHALSVFGDSSILNRYTALSQNATVGDLSIEVQNIMQLAGSYSFPKSKNLFFNDVPSVGDMIMIIQVQGAEINLVQNITFGKITNYRQTGLYEFAVVSGIVNNTILLCKPLKNSYEVGGTRRAQVVRVPRFQNLTVSNENVVTGKNWNGENGGIVSVEVNGLLNINDGVISASGIGFRGGIDTASASPFATNIYYSSWDMAANKGESIAGNFDDYDAAGYLCGRGAIANGGGGGNGHNNGGGGGANASANLDTTGYNGTGIKPNDDVTWAQAWDLESPGFSTNISPGGGRGGYSYANTDMNALIEGPGSAAWGGDLRRNNGGLGGYPLLYISAHPKLFFGGGGGAGEDNNSSSGNGGAGGGIVSILSYGNIQGQNGASIVAKGMDGFNTRFEHRDAAGGGGGGGAILLQSASLITGVTVEAKGGNGGFQDFPKDNGFKSAEVEGPGGAGGGGYVVSTSIDIAPIVDGGIGGLTNSDLMVEFLPNGATSGSTGAVEIKDLTNNLQTCSILNNESAVYLTINSYAIKPKLKWTLQTTTTFTEFFVERSINGKDYNLIGKVGSLGANTEFVFTDESPLVARKVWYRVKGINANFSVLYSNSVVLLKQSNNNEIELFPNPATDEVKLIFSEPKYGPITVNIFNSVGKEVQRHSTQLVSSGAQNFSIPIQNLPKGLYFLRICINNLQEYSKKLLVY